MLRSRHRIPPDLEARAARLTAQHLLALQLVARGHSVAQVATLTATSEVEVERVLAAAVRILGVPKRRNAVVVLRHLGLIV